MWWYNLGIVSEEAGDDLTELSAIREQDIFPHTKYGELLGKRNSKIVSDVHILTLWPVNTPENHGNLIKDGFLSHTMANVLRISYGTLITKFQAQIWSLW